MIYLGITGRTRLGFPPFDLPEAAATEGKRHKERGFNGRKEEEGVCTTAKCSLKVCASVVPRRTRLSLPSFDQNEVAATEGNRLK